MMMILMMVNAELSKSQAHREEDELKREKNLWCLLPARCATLLLCPQSASGGGMQASGARR